MSVKDVATAASAVAALGQVNLLARGKAKQAKEQAFPLCIFLSGMLPEDATHIYSAFSHLLA